MYGSSRRVDFKISSQKARDRADNKAEVAASGHD